MANHVAPGGRRRARGGEPVPGEVHDIPDELQAERGPDPEAIGACLACGSGGAFGDHGVSRVAAALVPARFQRPRLTTARAALAIMAAQCAAATKAPMIAP